jgi:hypothetical protein
MTDLTVKVLKTPEGYDFVRSDGEHFFLVGKDDGHAVLYAGRRNEPPTTGLVDLDKSVSDKLGDCPECGGIRPPSPVAEMVRSPD